MAVFQVNLGQPGPHCLLHPVVDSQKGGGRKRRQGGHEPEKLRIPRDFSECGKLVEFSGISV